MGRAPRRAALTFSCILIAASMAGSLTVPTSGIAPSITRAELLRIARIDPPPAGIGLRIHVDFPVERPYPVGGISPVTAITARITPEGRFEVVGEIASPASDGSSDASLDRCTDPAFVPEGVAWAEADLPIRWLFNARSRPKPLSDGLTEGSLRRGANAWSQTTTDCDDDTKIDFSSEYVGRTYRRVGYDDRNVIDFGKLGGDALAVTYVWYRDGRALEFDMRLQKRDWQWTNLKRYERRYQIANIGTHEFGHVVGLDDLGNPHGGLTMYGRAGRGELKKTTLGRGDIRGAKVVTR